LSNPSSGKTGYALAEECARRGAQVVLVSGPTELSDPFGCEVVRVVSAEEMFAAAKQAFDELDPYAAVFTAAVADFRPATRSEQKLKKGARGSETTLQLIANPDILATLAAGKGETFVVGFAAETQDVLAAAATKLEAKNADLIVANDVSDPSLGFAGDQNRWHFVSKAGVETTEILHKRTLAGLLVDKIVRAT
jgi:phosphopantothenoylcysteine decarboxylase/phosphopantothenate--cysteine ligase